MLFGLLVFGAIVALVFAFVATYNGLVAAADKATRAWNELDALLRQRHDEHPEARRDLRAAYAEGAPVLDRLLEARTAVFAARQTRDADDLSRAEATLRAAATAFMTRAAEHARPRREPRVQLAAPAPSHARSRDQDRRDRYNEAVRVYNAAITRAPGNLVALVGEFPPLRPLDFTAGS